MSYKYLDRKPIGEDEAIGDGSGLVNPELLQLVAESEELQDAARMVETQHNIRLWTGIGVTSLLAGASLGAAFRYRSLRHA